MDVSSLEHVVIRAKLGDIIGFQIIQIAEQTASFQLTIIALAMEIVPTYRDLQVLPNQCGNHKSPQRDTWKCIDIHSEDCGHYLRYFGCPRAIDFPHLQI